MARLTDEVRMLFDGKNVQVQGTAAVEDDPDGVPIDELEIGSGPGRDADFHGNSGVEVHCTGHEVPRHRRQTFCAAPTEHVARAEARP